MAFKKKKKPVIKVDSTDVFIAVLSGLIAKYGAQDSSGKPAVNFVEIALEYAHAVEEQGTK